MHAPWQSNHQQGVVVNRNVAARHSWQTVAVNHEGESPWEPCLHHWTFVLGRHLTAQLNHLNCRVSVTFLWLFIYCTPGQAMVFVFSLWLNKILVNEKCSHICNVFSCWQRLCSVRHVNTKTCMDQPLWPEARCKPQTFANGSQYFMNGWGLISVVANCWPWFPR